MAEPSHITISRAVQIPGEHVFLDAVADDLTNENAKLVYADWLEDQGDSVRGAFLRKYIEAYRSMKPEDFPAFDDVPAEWARMIGAKLVKAMATHGFTEHRDEVLPLARPSLIYEVSELEGRQGMPVNDSKFPLGGSKLYGLPDLPAGSKWPQQKDCNSLYDSNSGIAPETPCGFIAQINLAELAGTQAARMFPEQGLLSFFSCAEIENIGMVDGLVIFTPDISNLVRLEPPKNLVYGLTDQFDESNEILDARQLVLSETLELPCACEESPFPQIKWNYDHPLSDPYWEMLETADADQQLNSFLGFTTPTSSDDPLPGAEWVKLLCINNTVEIRLHFCVKIEDLKAGKFDQVELAYVDFDG